MSERTGWSTRAQDRSLDLTGPETNGNKISRLLTQLLTQLERK